MAPHDKERRGLGYAAAIALSALGHAAFLYLVLFALPRWFISQTAPPPAYSVNIVDNIPAGDLGTHLPRLSGGNPPEPEEPQESPPEKEPEPHENEPPAPPVKVEANNDDPNAFALNKKTATAEPTPEITATPTPTPEPTEAASPAPTQKPTARPTRRPRPTARPTHRPRPTARPTPRPRPRHTRAVELPLRQHHRGLPSSRPTPKVMLARSKERPAREESVKEQIARVHEELMREHLKALADARKKSTGSSENEGGEDEEGSVKGAKGGASGGGPVVGTVAGGGKGYGIGSGTGSVGMLKDREFVLYYQTVEERIKEAWSFYGGSKDLTTTVEFAIGPDGKVAGISVKQSSNNASFDQSVVRAVRLAAPFPPPPEKYRDQFAQGVEAVFKLGELRS